jgi:DnaK suppressor protein
LEIAVSKYESLREKLSTTRNELQRRLQGIRQDVRNTEPLAQDFAEQAVERENEEVLDALEIAARAELRQVNAAFERIEQDEYGLCVECGNAIPMERLEVLPYTDRCVSCAEKGEASR